MESTAFPIREAHEVSGATINSDHFIRNMRLIGGTSIYNAKDGEVSDQVRSRKYPWVGDGPGVRSSIDVDDAARATT